MANQKVCKNDTILPKNAPIRLVSMQAVLVEGNSLHTHYCVPVRNTLAALIISHCLNQTKLFLRDILFKPFK